MNRKETINEISEKKIIAIVRGVDQRKIYPLLSALADGNIRLVELTFDQKSLEKRIETAQIISEMSREFKGILTLGIGTVVTLEQAKLAIDAGAKFIISPNTDEATIAATVENDLVSIPGALTPTEIVNAHAAGADFVKIFPSDTLGLPYIKALRAPLSHIPMLAVGGVNVGNISDFLSAGVSGVGVGGNLIDKDLIAAERYDEITKIALSYTTKIANYCNKNA